MAEENRVRYWLELAAYDFETAKAMLETKRFLYVGFMCHQVIEKILKAYHVSKTGENPPYIHNLTLLAEKSSILESLSDAQKDFLDYLEPLNIEARYPTVKEKIFATLTEGKCMEIIKKTEELYKWILEKC